MRQLPPCPATSSLPLFPSAFPSGNSEASKILPTRVGCSCPTDVINKSQWSGSYFQHLNVDAKVTKIHWFNSSPPYISCFPPRCMLSGQMSYSKVLREGGPPNICLSWLDPFNHPGLGDMSTPWHEKSCTDFGKWHSRLVSKPLLFLSGA